MKPPTHGLSHQFMPCGVEIHFIDAVTVAVVAAQSGYVTISFQADFSARWPTSPSPQVLQSIRML